MAAKTERTEVTSTDFQNAAGAYLEKSAKAPVFITKHRRPARVLMDIDEYERLKSLDKKQFIRAEDVSDEQMARMMDFSDLPEESHAAQRELDGLKP